MDKQDKKRERSSNFSSSEVNLLMKCVSQEMYHIENKKIDSASLKEKQDAWRRVKISFNHDTTEQPRDMNTLRMKYVNIKRSFRKKLALLSSTGEQSTNAIKLTWYEKYLSNLITLPAPTDGLTFVEDSDSSPITSSEIGPENIKSEYGESYDNVEEDDYMFPLNNLENMEQNSNECKPIEKRIDQINVYLPTTSSESLIDSTNSNTSHSVNEKQEECFKKPNSKSLINLRKRKYAAASVRWKSFQKLTDSKAEIAEVQKICFDTDLKIKAEELENRKKEWEKREELLHLEMNMKREQLNEILLERKRKDELHFLAMEQERLKLEILKFELNYKRQQMNEV